MLAFAEPVIYYGSDCAIRAHAIGTELNRYLDAHRYSDDSQLAAINHGNAEVLFLDWVRLTCDGKISTVSAAITRETA